jgi:signal transduction histidine kinase
LDLDQAEDRVPEGTAEADARSAISEVITQLRPIAERKEQTLTVVIPDTPPLVAIDPAALTQVIRNLVDNAISYTQPGGCIDISADELAGRLVVKVRDNGPGIPAQSQERLFEQFYTVGSRHTIGKEGSGLGLAIVQRVVSDAGGEVGVVSEEGKGSTFWFWLPARRRS